MTTSFYAPPSSIRGSQLFLPEEEAHHAFRVLRKRPGDEIIVVDGEGGWYRVELEHVDKRAASGRIIEAQREVGEPDYELTIGMAVLKNRNRFETFLEKAVEVGVREIVPLLTERTEKERIKETRAQNILVAAMKQSQRSRLVRLHEPVPLEDVLEEGAFDLSMICHEQVDAQRSMLNALSDARPRRLRVLVGPEGGFTDDEVAAALQAGCRPVSLGPRRLRAETAALVAASAVMLSR